ncbi:hypothetical protein ACN38_g11205 [Penicillium nordicum]|uniref:Uncharacterized protein n=1 Tax=Penicillium nordicum TaxID=229535 RepID=A0A0M8NZ72_9EURO|nr:hypothetical protein ACN38_g11205 [Penicillium nordicum]
MYLNSQDTEKKTENPLSLLKFTDLIFQTTNMVNKLVLGAIFTGLNSIGLWHSIPFTGITPSNTFFWRGLNSLEIVYSIHTLHKIHPLVFPDYNKTSDYDLLLQLSLDVKQYEKARLALQNSANAVPQHLHNTESTTTMLDLGATAMPASFYLNNGSTTELNHQQPQFNSAQDHTVFLTFISILIFVILGMQMMGFAVTKNTKQHVEDLHYDYIKGMRVMQEQFGILMFEIQKLQRQNEQVRSVAVHLAESITNSSADLQHCLLHIVGMMDNKYTSSMIDIESKLDEVGEQHLNLMKNTENFPQIPRQLAWLNILMAKSMSSDLPEGLHPPLDLSKSPTPEQMDGGYNRNSPGRPNKIPRWVGGQDGNKGKGAQSNGQD